MPPGCDVVDGTVLRFFSTSSGADTVKVPVRDPGRDVFEPVVSDTRPPAVMPRAPICRASVSVTDSVPVTTA